MGIVDVRIGISLASALPTVNGPERSVSRESVAAAKRQATAHASITPCWRADVKRAMRLDHGRRAGSPRPLPLDSADAGGDFFFRIDDRDERLAVANTRP
jgi:hypothetical protein